MKKKHKQVNTEQYEVSYSMKWPAGGNIVVYALETVTVEVTEGMVEKDNHELAAQMVLKKRPGANITGVRYQ